MNRSLMWLIFGVTGVAVYFFLQKVVHPLVFNFESVNLLFWIILWLTTAAELGGGLWALYRYVRPPEPKTPDELAAEGIETPPPPPAPRLPPLQRAVVAGVALGAVVSGSFLFLNICFLSLFGQIKA